MTKKKNYIGFKVIVFSVLATDLSHHIGILKDQQKLITQGYDTNNPKQKRLVLYLFMTCADLSDQTKDWKSSKKIAVSNTMVLAEDLKIYALFSSL